MQDAIAIAVAVAAAAWLARSLVARLRAPACGPPTPGPAGSDGFVPLETLAGPASQAGVRRPGA
ncbi:MAG: hypothetical protein EBZ59_06705 [Planctomycetia bacterium]|nr:hypothetical protein [Planctomycetia bacterium]